MPCLTPYRGDTSQMLLFKIASCLEANPGGGGVTSFNGQTGAVILSLADVAAVADGRYVLKAGDTMTGALVHPDGTAALPSITFTGDLDTGIYHPAADTVAISVGGSFMASVSSAGVGIGVMAPLGRLDVRQLVAGNTAIYGRRLSDTLGGTGSLIRFQTATGLLDVYRVDTGGNTIQGKLTLQFGTGGDSPQTFLLDAGDQTQVANSQLYRFRQYLTTGGTVTSFGIDLKRDNANLGGYNALLVNSTEDAVGTATSFLLNIQRNSTSVLTVQSGGLVSLATAVRLSMASGANQRAGDVVLVAGTVTTANTTVTANTRVYTSRRTAGGVLGNLTYTIIAATSFTITSDNIADTSTVSYLLIEIP